MMSNQLVTIATFVNSLEASIAKQTLEAENIPAFVMDDETVSFAWHLSIAVGWIKLKVFRSDVEEAVDILTAYNIEVHPVVDLTGSSRQNLTEGEINQSQDEQDIDYVSKGDRILNQAFKVAVIGLFGFPFFFLQLYSFALLISLLITDLQTQVKISPRNYWKIILTVIFNIFSLYLLWLLISSLLP